MKYMFYGCWCLKKLNIANFDTKNVKSMNCMFNTCSALKELNINKFNINKLVDISGMFKSCSEDLIKKIKNKFKNLGPKAFK